MRSFTSSALLLAVLATMVNPSLAFAAFSPAVPDSPVAIDFSYAGYEAGGPLPAVPAVLTVKPSDGDDTALLQGAIDRIASPAPQAPRLSLNRTRCLRRRGYAA
jgi:hypothetical protein